MTLREIYVADLNQLLEATRQKLLEWPILAARAQAPLLRETFDEHYAQTRNHFSSLEALFERLDERPRHTRADAFTALLELWRTRHREMAAGDVRELSLITTAVAIDYHTLPLYAEAMTAARSLGDVDAAHMLQAALTAERDRTNRLTVFHDWIATRLSGGVTSDRWTPGVSDTRTVRPVASSLTGGETDAAPARAPDRGRSGE